MKIEVHKKFEWTTFDKIEIGDVFKTYRDAYYIKISNCGAIDLHKNVL